jgi:hypothetical protein
MAYGCGCAGGAICTVDGVAAGMAGANTVDSGLGALAQATSPRVSVTAVRKRTVMIYLSDKQDDESIVANKLKFVNYYPF